MEVPLGVHRHQRIGHLAHDPGGFDGSQRPGAQQLLDGLPGLVFVDHVGADAALRLHHVQDAQEA